MKKFLSLLLAAIVLTAVLSVSVSAADYKRPADRDYNIITIIVDGDKGGTATSDPVTVPKGETSKITAKPDPGYEFSGWVIEGEYEIVEGDLNSAVIVIRPLTDVTVRAKFTGTASRDSGSTSPTTGSIDNSAFVSVVVALVISFSAAAVVVTGRKYFSAK